MRFFIGTRQVIPTAFTITSYLAMFFVFVAVVVIDVLEFTFYLAMFFFVVEVDVLDFTITFYLAMFVVVSRKFCRAPLKSRPTDRKSLWNSFVNLNMCFQSQE